MVPIYGRYALAFTIFATYEIYPTQRIYRMRINNFCAHLSKSLFVFSISDRKQKASSLLTPVSEPDCYALSYYGSFQLLNNDE